MLELFDLPAHPLLVHAPVVLLPLTLLLLVVLAFRPSWRRSSGWAMVLATGACFVTAFLAKTSGEKFDEALNKQFTVDRSLHNDLAHQTLLFLGVLLLLAVALAVQDFRFERSMNRVAALRSEPDGSAAAVEPSSMASHLTMLATLVIAVVATIWMIRTGHEGAKLVHEGRI